MKRNLLCLILCLCTLFAFRTDAQIADGTFVPNFEAKDLDGNSHNLYDILSQGYRVVLDLSATWCGPCWNYHNGGAFKTLHDEYGPNGTQELYVIMVEADDGTTLEDLQGTGNSTTGDWITGTPYPIIDNGGFIASILELAYYPTIYTICPDGRVYESGQITAQQHYDFAMGLDCQPIPEDVGILTDANTSFCEGPFDAEVTIVNVGTEMISGTEVTMMGCDNCPLTQTISSDLGFWNYEKIVFEGINSNESEVNLTFEISDTIGNLANDQAGTDVAIGFVDAFDTWTIELFTDCYPGETSWDVRDEAGNVILKNDPYTEAQDSSVQVISIPSNGCYIFRFYDSYGDGLNGSAFSCPVDGYCHVYSDAGTIFQTDGTDQFSVVINNTMVELSVNTEDVFTDASISLAPNPTRGIATLNINNLEVDNLQLQILDLTGKVIQSKSFGVVSQVLNDELDLSSYSSGMYIVKLMTDAMVHTEKIVVE